MPAPKLWYFVVPALVGCSAAAPPVASTKTSTTNQGGTGLGIDTNPPTPSTAEGSQPSKAPSAEFSLRTLGVVDLATTAVATADLGVFVDAAPLRYLHLASASISLPPSAANIQYLAPSADSCGGTEISALYSQVPEASASMVAYSLPGDPASSPSIASSSAPGQIVTLGGKTLARVGAVSSTPIAETFTAPAGSGFPIDCTHLVGFATVITSSPPAEEVDAATISFTVRTLDGNPVEGLSSTNVVFSDGPPAFGLINFGQSLVDAANGSYSLAFYCEPWGNSWPPFSIDLVDVPATGSLF